MRAFYDRRLLVTLSVLLIMLSFSSVIAYNGLRSQLTRQAEMFLTQPAEEELGEKITNPDFALYFPEQITVTTGEIFIAPLYLLANGPVESFTAYLRFDPQFLTVREIRPLEAFQRYPEVFYDNGEGLVELTGETDFAFQGDQGVAEIEFFAQQAGTTKLYFSLNEEGEESRILQSGLNVIQGLGDADVFVED